jgi:Fe-S oxidoreductase
MGSTWKLLNVGAFVALGGHLGSLAVTSISSGHPDSLTCYECRACAGPCPWKLDPSGYLVAARVNNPNRRMLAQYNVKRYNRFIGNRQDGKRLTLDDLKERDEYMKVIIGTVKEKQNITLFTLGLSYLASIVEGPVDENLRDAFEENRWIISSGATISQTGPSTWDIMDDPEVYHIENAGAELTIAGEKKVFDKLDPMQITRAMEELKKYKDEGKEAEFTDVYEMQAKDSAFYDPLCARCEPVCPVALRITKFIRDVKADEKYR